MKKSTTLILFYSGVVALSAGILWIALSLRSGLQGDPAAMQNIPAINQGVQPIDQWFEISEDLEATNQAGETVRLSDLKGKVWVMAEFFAVCPHCAVRNGEDLRGIYDQFSDHPDFHFVCLSVDPDTDDQAKLSDYSDAVGADVSNWWFLNAGTKEKTHRYLEEVMKFMGIRERTDPLDIESNGLYSHDLGLILVDKEFNVVGKWPLADARSEEGKRLYPGNYEHLKADMIARIETELAKPAPAAADETSAQEAAADHSEAPATPAIAVP